MKPEENKNSIEQIARYLANEMDDNERANFEIDMKLEKGSCALLNELDEDWKMLESYNNRKRVDTNKAWDKLNSRIAASQDEVSKPRKAARMSIIKWASVAAMLAGIVTIGAALLLNSGNTKSIQMVSMMNSNSGNTVVQSLADGSIIYLNNNTRFSYPQVFASDSRKVSLKGEAYFDIARNPKKPFIIETNNAIVEVLGTAFNIKTYAPGKFELVVERGKVKVTLKDHPEVTQIVVAGEKMDLANKALVKSKWNDDGSLMWRIGKMQFKDETLSTIVKVINANYNTNIAVKSPETAERRLTVTFNNNSIDDILQLLCVAMDLQIKKTGDQTVITDSNEK